MEKEMKIKVSTHLVLVNVESKIWAYNSLFGGLRVLTEEEKVIIDILKDDKNHSDLIIQEKLLEKLLLDKFVVYSDEDEYAYFNKLLEKYKLSIRSGESISKLLLYVAESCNLRCRYCYINETEKANTSSDKKLMGWEIAKVAIDAFYKIITRTKKSIVHIRFHGGEPLINFVLIKQCIEYIDKLFVGVKVCYRMNTNGVLLTEEMAKYLASKNVYIEISIDGNSVIHNALRPFANGSGSFDNAIYAIELLTKYGLCDKHINIATTLTNYNVEVLNELVDISLESGLKNLEINTLLFSSLYDVKDIEKRATALVNARIYGVQRGISVTGKWFKLVERLKDTVFNYCGRFGQQIAVDLSGNIFVCTGDFQTYGTVHNIEEFLENKNYLELALRGIGTIPACRCCPIEGACAGGCTAAVLHEYGEYNIPEYKECDFRKKIVTILLSNIDKIVDNKVDFEEVDSSYVPVICEKESNR